MSAVARSQCERAQVHHHRAARVGHVGDVQAAVGAAGQVPDQPGVHVAEDQIAGVGLLAGAVDVLEDPADLRARRSRWPAAGPTCRGSGPGRPTCASSSTILSVRVSCQTSALWTGSPVVRSQTTVVSRWLVIPSAGDVVLATAPASSAPRRAPPGSAPRSPWGRARPSPAWDRSARAPSVRPTTTRPEWSKTIARELVVPWSIATAYLGISRGAYAEPAPRRRLSRRRLSRWRGGGRARATAPASPDSKKYWTRSISAAVSAERRDRLAERDLDAVALGEQAAAQALGPERARAASPQRCR